MPGKPRGRNPNLLRFGEERAKQGEVLGDFLNKVVSGRSTRAEELLLKKKQEEIRNWSDEINNVRSADKAGASASLRLLEKTFPKIIDAIGEKKNEEYKRQLVSQLKKELNIGRTFFQKEKWGDVNDSTRKFGSYLIAMLK